MNRLQQTEIHQSIWDSYSLTPQQKLILLALLHYGQPFPGISILSGSTRIPPKRVTQIVRQLEKSGALVWKIPPGWTWDPVDCPYRIDEEKFSPLKG